MLVMHSFVPSVKFPEGLQHAKRVLGEAVQLDGLLTVTQLLSSCVTLAWQLSAP